MKPERFNNVQTSLSTNFTMSINNYEKKKKKTLRNKIKIIKMKII